MLEIRPYQTRADKPRLATTMLCNACSRTISVNITGRFIDHDDKGGFPCIGSGEEPVDTVLREDVVELVTLQFSWGDLFNGKLADNGKIHLVCGTKRGTPGPTLCGIDRFGKGGPGWSVGGGLSGPSITLTPCQGCELAARTKFPGLPISGLVGGREMAKALGVIFRG